MKEEIVWHYLDEGLPEIPEGKHGISVLLTTYDRYEEEQEGNGYTVSRYSYLKTKGWLLKSFKDGAISKYYEDSPLEADFMTQIVSYRNHKLEGVTYGPLTDEIIAWAYLPQAAKRKERS